MSAVSPANVTNDNSASARRLTDNTVAKVSKQEDSQTPQSNTAIITPNQGETPIQSNDQGKENVEKALKIINMAYKEVNIECKYSVDDRTNMEVVKIINSNTGETIKQYPPEDILNMIHKMYDMFGILMDEKV